MNPTSLTKLRSSMSEIALFKPSSLAPAKMMIALRNATTDHLNMPSRAALLAERLVDLFNERLELISLVGR